MTIPDINLLVYAHNDGAPFHLLASRWWEDLVNGSERVGARGSSQQGLCV